MHFLRITGASTRDRRGLDRLYSASVWRFYKVLLETCKRAPSEDESSHTWVS